MEWWQAVILGIIQGLTEFLPVSSSGHLMIFKEILRVNADDFWDFTLFVHLATVMSTLVVFYKDIFGLLKGFFKFRNNDETDFILKIFISVIPVAFVGLFLKDKIDEVFNGEGIFFVGVFLVITSVLLLLSDIINARREKKGGQISGDCPRNGISYKQAFLVGVAQAFAVAPGLSRSGTTIAVGLMSGVKKEVMAKFSFLMILIPIIGERFLDMIKVYLNGGNFTGTLPANILLIAFLSAFISGLLACKIMISIVRRTKLGVFSFYCLVVAILIFTVIK